jgi:hypothetical protein
MYPYENFGFFSSYFPNKMFFFDFQYPARDIMMGQGILIKKICFWYNLANYGNIKEPHGTAKVPSLRNSIGSQFQASTDIWFNIPKDDLLLWMKKHFLWHTGRTSRPWLIRTDARKVPGSTCIRDLVINKHSLCHIIRTSDPW